MLEPEIEYYALSMNRVSILACEMDLGALESLPSIAEGSEDENICIAFGLVKSKPNDLATRNSRL